MKMRKFPAYIISLLMILAICGAGCANVWAYSDFHGHNLHIDKADINGTDMDDVKHKISILPAIIAVPYVFSPPTTVKRQSIITFTRITSLIPSISFQFRNPE
jgi:hypothetical protein